MTSSIPVGAIGSSPQGGYVYPSNYYGPLNYNDSRSTYAIPTPSQGSVLGVSTTAPYSTSTSSTSSSSGSGSVTGGPAGTDASLPTQPDTAALDSAYNPLLDYLGQAESSLRSGLPSYYQDINNTADTSKRTLGTNYNSTLSQISGQQDQGARQKDNVIAASRRLFQELQQGNLQRFGAGGTGQFASELQGRELQRNTGSANQQYTDLVQQLGQKRIEVDSNYQTGLKQIEDQKQSAINDVNRQFQEKLNQINQQRGQVESAKAQARLDALQSYRDQVYQIQLQNYQMNQQLQQYKSSADTQLQSYLDQLGKSGQQAQGITNAYMQSNVSPTGSNFAATPGRLMSGNPYVGQIMKKTEDLYNTPTYPYSA